MQVVFLQPEEKQLDLITTRRQHSCNSREYQISMSLIMPVSLCYFDLFPTLVNMNFEARLKEIHAAKDSTLRLNPKVIEAWINDTLVDAEHLDIPGVVLKPDHKNPISRYGIDRLSLTNAGIPSE